MRIVLPEDPDGSWRAGLSAHQRRYLADVARGWSGCREVDRIAVVRTNYGFDVVGMIRRAVVDGEGAPIPDAWSVACVNEAHADYTLIDPVKARKKYGHSARRIYGRKLKPSEKRARSRSTRLRNARRRKEARDKARRLSYERGLAEHIGAGLNPMTYVHEED